MWLSDTAYMVVDFTMVKGRIVSFVVRLMLIQGDQEHNVARYDTAHGAPHRDLLDATGRSKDKKWLLGLDLDAALNYAVEDFKNNYARYIAGWN